MLNFYKEKKNPVLFIELLIFSTLVYIVMMVRIFK